MKTYNIVIIGSGPAGLTAAIYAARSEFVPLVIKGVSAGGQLMITNDVENFPGFHEGIMGPQLIENMTTQAERFGTQFHSGSVQSIQVPDDPIKEGFIITLTDETQIKARSIIIATGARARLLPLPAVDALMGHGVSACATCDGFFYKGKKVIVVGGGDSAAEEALFLTRFAEKVYMVHRRDQLRASRIMADRVAANNKIEVLWNSVLADIYDIEKGKVTGVRLKDTKTDEERDMDIDGVFFGIGHIPATEFLHGVVDLNEKKYIIVSDHSRTSVEGIFAAGDCVDALYQQAITSAGMGCAAAIDAGNWLAENGISDS